MRVEEVQSFVLRLNYCNIMTKKFINKLDSIISSLDDISVNLDKLSNSGFWEKYFPALIGIIGVLIGTFLAYLFNRRVKNNEMASKFMIQRKNLIYAPIYKELLELMMYIKENGDACYLCIAKNNYLDMDYIDDEYYFNGKTHLAGKFVIWNKIKNDIRKVYVPKNLRKKLEIVNINIDKYSNEKKKINTEFNNFGKSIIMPMFNKRGVPSGLNEPPPCLFKKSKVFENDKILDHVDKILLKEEYTDIKDEIVRKYKDFVLKIETDSLFENYDNMIFSIEDADKEVNKLVKYIIIKYEYGKKMEKYR